MLVYQQLQLLTSYLPNLARLTMSTHITQQDTVDSQQNQLHIGCIYFYTFNTEKTAALNGLSLPVVPKTFSARGNLSQSTASLFPTCRQHILETDPVHGTADAVVIQELFNGT